MPRKESISKELLIQKAFEIARENGYSEITARKLSTYIGCSTQPIFRNYAGMEDLINDVYEKALLYFYEYYENFPKEDSTPFVNLGLAYILFGQKEKNLFTLLFLSDVRKGRSLYELLNGEAQFLKKEIGSASASGCKNPTELFMKMWIYIHGAACMSLTDDYDLDEKATVQLLRDAYRKFS